MDKNKIKNELRKYVNSTFVHDQNLSDDESLSESGYVDSIGIIEIIDFMSKKFDITIPDEKLLPENVDTIENCAKLVMDIKNETI